MRRSALFSLLLLVPVPAVAQIDNTPLECGSDATYFPRGDHWAMTPPASTNPVVYRQHSGPPVSGALDEVRSAFNTWMTTTCNGESPNILVKDATQVGGQNYGSRDRGDTYECPDGKPCGQSCDTNECNIVSWQNIIYFVNSNWAAIADPMTVALTTNLYIPDTGMIVTADMEFNNVDFNWRTDTSSSGCSGACFHVETVALHEAGHFLGFNHVSCTDAVMFPQGSGGTTKTSLSHHEITGLCTVYAPRDNSVPNRDFMEQCTSTSECSTGLLCIKPASVPGASSWGWCSRSCTTNANCGTGFVCVQQDGGLTKFCRPGVNNTGGAVDDSTDPTSGESRDLCMPCTAGDQCASGVCISEGGPNGICTRTCVGGTLPDSTPAGDCPYGMTCTPTDEGWAVCWADPGTCGGPAYRAVLNETCFIQGATTNDDWYKQCGPDLICFGFKPRCEGQIGACVQYCNPGRPCNDGNMTCCFGVDALGACLGSSAGDHGGCFDLRRAGESCATPEQSICESGSSCFHFGDPVLSKCYTLCPSSQTCTDTETCMTFSDGCSNQFSLCCDDDELPDACLPGDDILFFDVGVACRRNEECDSGMCLNFDGQSACSRWCNPVTGVGCPGNIDVNADGVADGGFRCVLPPGLGQGRCWPLDGPADPPATAADSSEPPGGCCNSTSRRAGDVLLSLLLWLPLVVFRFWQRRCS